MRKYTGLLLLILLWNVYSCSHSSSPSPDNSIRNIVFTGLKPGQANYYVRLVGENDRDLINNAFHYENDTLIVAVVGRDSFGYKLAETLSPNSVSKGTGCYVKDTNIYYLNIINDSLKIRAGTHSIIFRDLPIYEFNNNPVNQYGWKTSISWSNYSQDTSGYIINFQTPGKTYERLNVLVKNKAMERDAPGRGYIYSKEAGIVRMTEYGGYKGSPEGGGWDLLR